MRLLAFVGHRKVTTVGADFAHDLVVYGSWRSAHAETATRVVVQVSRTHLIGDLVV